jgi:hypothetical protein
VQFDNSLKIPLWPFLISSARSNHLSHYIDTTALSSVGWTNDRKRHSERRDLVCLVQQLFANLVWAYKVPLEKVTVLIYYGFNIRLRTKLGRISDTTVV